MKTKALMKYTVKSWGMLVYISVVFCVIVFWMMHTDLRYDKANIDELIEEHGSISQAIAEGELTEDMLTTDHVRPYIMMGAGLFGGSVGMIIEMFGIAMQFGVSRKTLKWAYLIHCIYYALFISLAMYLNQFIMHAWFTSRCTGVYEVLKPAYEGIDTSILMLGNFLLFSLPMLFAGSCLWAMLTRFRKSIAFFIALIVCIICIVFGIVMAVIYEYSWLIYVIGAAAAVVFLIILFRLISTETVEHKIST